MSDSIQTQAIVSSDDTEELISKAKAVLEQYVTSVRNHFRDTGNKSSCSVTLEFASNKDDELVIKIIPKLTLPLETEEYIGELNSKGELKLI